MKKYMKKKAALMLLGVMSLGQSWAQDHSLNFDGVKDYVQWGDPEQGFLGPYANTPLLESLTGSDFTVELWIKSDFAEWPGPHGVVFAFNSYNPTHASNRLILGINTAGRLYIHDGDNTGLSTLKWTGPTVVTDGECRHIAFTHNVLTKETKVYVDGVQEGASLFSTFVLDETDLFCLGQEWDNLDGLHVSEPHAPSQFFYGDMDDIRIWTKEKMASDISDNMETVYSPSEPDLLGYYKVDQGIASDDNTAILTLDNETAFPDLDGELVGFTRLTGVSNFVLDPCAPDPCSASMDTSFIHINEDIIITSDEFWDNKYYVNDEVIVTVSNGATLDITNVDVVFGQCAGIVVENNASVRVNNSVLRPCNVDGTWRGITFNGGEGENTSENIINESTFKNAQAALFFNGATDALISNNLFSNCNQGVRAVSNTYFSHSISGNRFVIEAYYPNYDVQYDACHAFVDNNIAYGIWTDNVAFAQHVSQNEFINSNGSGTPMVTGVSMKESSGTVSNNTFTDMLHAVVVNQGAGYTSISNNTVEVNYPTSSPIATNNISILVDGTYGPLVEINGNVLVNNENEVLSYAAIGVNYASNISIASNQIEGFSRGITVLNAHNSQITQNDIVNSGSIGIYYRELPGPIPTSSYITCNSIKMKTYRSTGIYVERMDKRGEISSNCVLDCGTSIFLRDGITLPKIRNNYLYNYTNAGIDIRDYMGDIGTGAADPGMNTFWSNDNGAFDIYSSPGTVSVYDNFGMFNLSLATISVISSNPAHSTASCGHQIFESPSQGNLNTDYVCDNKTRFAVGMVHTSLGVALAPNYTEEVQADPAPFYAIRTIVGSVENLDKTQLDILIESVEISENEVALLNYLFYLKRGEFDAAKEALTVYLPLAEEQVMLKELQLLNLKIQQEGIAALTNEERSFIETVLTDNGVHVNYGIHLLNQLYAYTDYKFQLPTLVESENLGTPHILQEQAAYLNVYPNPTTGITSIEIELPEAGDELEIRTVSGQLVKTIQPSFVAGITEIDLTELAQGIYYIVLTNPSTGVKQQQKLIKMAQ